MTDTKPEKIMRELVKMIDAFDRECEAASGTDTTEAWDLFDVIRGNLSVAIASSKKDRARQIEDRAKLGARRDLQTV